MWIKNTWKKLKQFFRGQSYTYQDSADQTVKKQFTISNTTRVYVPGKKFVIKARRQAQIVRNGKMNIIGKSRPRNCIRCRSPKTVIKSQTNHDKWECSEAKGGCGYIW